MALSVGEMAELIRRPDSDRAAVVERLRTWTDDGLLDPQDRSVGTGRKREYADSAVYHAGILNELADYGVPVGKASYSGYLTMVHHYAEVARNAWVAEGHRRPVLHLEIADFGKGDMRRSRFGVFLHGAGKKDHLGDRIHPRAASAHLINLSRLFKRIDDRKKALDKAAAAERKQA
jgi:hypothetical protein